MKKYLLATGIILSISLFSACAKDQQDLSNTTEISNSINENKDADSLQNTEVKKSQKDKDSDSSSNAISCPEILKNKNFSLTYMNSETKRNTELEKAIIKAYGLSQENTKETRYYYDFIDLNGDNNTEVFVQLVGPYTSGTGGDAGLIFMQKDNAFTLLQKFTLIRNPIIISDQKTNGWHDIIIHTSGGGSSPHFVVMKFASGKYPNPSNASDLNANIEVSGKAIICDDIEPNSGLYLSSAQTAKNLKKDAAKITYEDQIAVEKAIKAFANAIENNDYKTAEEYCTPDFKEYLVNLTTGKGGITDGFSKAIIENVPLKLVSAKAYYDDKNSSEANFNVTKDNPTLNFLVSFNVKGAGGYTTGVKGNDGKWHISGFASGR